MKIEFNWTCTYQDYCRLSRAHAAAIAALPVQHNNSLIPSAETERRLLILGVAIVSLIAYLSVAAWAGSSLLVLLLGIPILTPLIWIWWNPAERVRFHDTWLNNLTFREPMSFVVSENTLTRTCLHSQVTFQWPAFTYAHEDDAFFLLFRGTQLVIVIPKAAFNSPEDLRNFRVLCGPAMSPPTKGFPVEPS